MTQALEFDTFIGGIACANLRMRGEGKMNVISNRGPWCGRGGFRSVLLVSILSVFAATQLGCDKGKSDDDKSSSKDKDKDGKDGKKKKKSKKSADDDDDKSSGKGEDKSKDDDDDDDDAPKNVEVPGTKGFVVPPGGNYKHNVFDIGDQKVVLDSYEYPVKDFPRPALRKSFGKAAKDAGWKLDGEIATAQSFTARKKGQSITVMFGENKPESTIINVAPPIPDDSGGDGDGAPAEDFTGVYNTNFGVATVTQTGSKVNFKYPIGTGACTAAGKVLKCHWIESNGSGDAILTKQTDGKLTGTWGNGQSATNGGGWTFTPKK